ncbi:lipocalin family protein [Mucilaginibacter gilvus]|uniref:Lipocalin-like domain-containing protein n=1 Tax=Mucilaginibacter gilvus TaxID=2305909 RepID=A0A444MIN8_9SPHI|nr:lipocalin family protein [Mucilaginibacter gilvus]RWY47966.1 hypothetical protein EPL05_20460 [Mucilaginibacter gilvus]
MKTIVKLTAVALILLIAACGKESKFLVNTSLQGKWKLSATYADPGDGSGKYLPVSASNTEYVQFKTDGTLAGTAFVNYESYAEKDSVTLIFTATDHITKQNFRYSIKGNELTMSPAGPIMCIEGCGERFTKIDQ